MKKETGKRNSISLKLQIDVYRWMYYIFMYFNFFQIRQLCY